ncbi:Trx7/PDZ domain-containing (seleno)protein [Planctomicrobium piriforme]|uniref:PDZ domain-containing protein n=1 Tax=Planctomicrobium piriforme TaxID=1576369 RepID=A0A1I3QXV4_9PLAN|nr:Trx7/PDZ domain-containing (seleno)protein [Planctomicrobium piriforme]SFJ38590.1 PDZ domain-containing protein [Planctomicrobium piriforme]
MRGALVAWCLLASVCLAQQQSREEKVLADRAHAAAQGFWIYNDIEQGLVQARLTGKPLLVLLRCIPCEECVKLDDALMEQDPVVRPLLEQFVCVRQVSTNGLDLDLFQYDTDQSFAVFLMNADGTIYGRYGTRSDRTKWEDDVSVVGLGQAMTKALELHRQHGSQAAALAGKKGKPIEFRRPEMAPALREKYSGKLVFETNVVKSCIHCHQIGEARREFYRAEGKPIPEAVLFPYPHPKAIGLKLDPKTCGDVLAVTPDSPADKSGFQRGDRIQRMSGQPILSMADVQWVLHNVDAGGGQVQVDVLRQDRPVSLTLSLPTGWRQADDLSWRVSSWGLSRMVLGGMRLETIPAEERTSLGIMNSSMALRVKSVGQYGPHATAKKAGFLKGDIIVNYDGQTTFANETALFHYAVNAHPAGESVAVDVVREGKTFRLMLPMQQ